MGYENWTHIPTSSGIYRIDCTTTGKFYIGSAINLRSRWCQHRSSLKRNEHKNRHLQSAWNKHGPESFTFTVLELVLPPFLIMQEQYWFNKLSPWDKKGFNLDRVAGSSLGRIVSQSSREKSRATQIGRPSTRIGWKPSPEQVEQHRRALTGYKQTEEHKRNAAMTRIGSKRSSETREKMHQSALGHTVSEETAAKIRAANKGRVPSEEERAKMSEAQSKRQRDPEEYTSRRKTVIVIDPNGIEYTVTGIHDFCKEHGLDGSALCKVVKGRYAHHKGWTARLPEEEVS